MQFRTLDDDIFDDVVQFIAKNNAKDTDHIGYFDTEPNAIAVNLKNFDPPMNKGTMVALNKEAIVGVVAANMNPALGRMWLHGPIIQHKNWHGIADILYQAIQPAIPFRINEYEIFCSIHNQNCQDFAERHKYKLHGEAAIYAYPRERLNEPAAGDVIEISPELFTQLWDLQDRLFPRSYYSGSQLTGKLGDHSKVFITVEDDTLTGYVACRVEPEFGVGYIDFVGVLESARRQGNARKIIHTAFNWMFGFESVQHVKLTVMTRNETACKLYETIGFDQVKKLMAYRKRYI